MDRREALKTTSFVVGYSLTASAIAAALQNCRTEPRAVAVMETEWAPAFFDQEQISLIAEITETLIPETTTPGARAVNVQQFIDDEVRHFYEPRDQYKFMMGLKDVQARANAEFGKDFQVCTVAERTMLLKRLEVETENEKEDGSTEGKSFFAMIKGMTYHGYFTSEKVGTEVLKYDPVPQTYQGCIPLADVGKLWSL